LQAHGWVDAHSLNPWWRSPFRGGRPSGAHLIAGIKGEMGFSKMLPSLGVVLASAACATGGGVPGHAGCTFAEGSRRHGVCDSTAAAERANEALLLARWQGRLREEVAGDFLYAHLAPSIRATSDGGEVWSYEGGDDCRVEETAASRMSRSMDTASRSVMTSQSPGCVTAAPSSACTSTNHTPPPPAVYERICPSTDWKTEFFVRNRHVTGVKYARLRDDRRF
jgi:hypothetical protein